MRKIISERDNYEAVEREILTNPSCLNERYLLDDKSRVVIDSQSRKTANGYTPIMHAAKLGRVEILKILISHKADTAAVIVLAMKHMTCVDLAVKEGHFEVVKILVEYGAPFRQEISQDFLNNARSAGYGTLANLLLEQNRALQERTAHPIVRELNKALPKVITELEKHKNRLDNQESKAENMHARIIDLGNQIQDHAVKFIKIEDLIELHKNNNEKEIMKIKDGIKEHQSKIVELEERSIELEERTKNFPKLLDLAKQYEQMHQRMDEFEGRLSEQEKQLIAFDQIKIDIEKNSQKIRTQEELVDNLQRDNEKTKEDLDDQRNELIRLKLDAADTQRILEALEAALMNEKARKALQGLVERTEEQERIDALDNKPYQHSFLNHFVQQINAVYLASSVIQTDIVKCDKKGIVGKIGGAIEILSRYVPLVGIAVKVCGSLLVKLDSKMQDKMIKNFYDLARGPVDIDTIAEKAALELLPTNSSLSSLDIDKLEQSKTFQDKLYNLLEFVVENVETIIDLVEGNNADRKKILLKETKSELQSLIGKTTRELTDDKKESLETIGKQHAGMIATILIAKIYHGEAKLTKHVSSIENKARILANMVLDEYGLKDPRVMDIARGISEQVALIITRGCKDRELKNDFITKLTDILSSIQYKDIILSEDFQSNKVFIIGSLVGRCVQDNISSESARGIWNISPNFMNNPSSFDFKLKKIVAEVILGYDIDIHNVNTHDDNQNSNLDDGPVLEANTKLHVLSVLEIIHDNPILNRYDLLNTAIKIAGSAKAKIISDLIDLCEDHEIAEQILEAIGEFGIEKVLEILFVDKIKSSAQYTTQVQEQTVLTKTQEDDLLLETITKIEAVIGKGALAELAGWHQYISKALSNNPLSKHATTVIQTIGNLVSSLEEWLDFGIMYESIDVDDQVAIILAQLENIMDFVASGITHVGLPPRYPDFDPDDYYGEGGSGSGGSDNDNSADINNIDFSLSFTGQNTTTILES